jgi:hypothetical protein
VPILAAKNAARMGQPPSFIGTAVDSKFSWKRMRSGDRPGLQNRRAAGYPVTGGFDPHSLPPFFNDLVPESCQFSSDLCQRPAYSLQPLAEHFRVHSHADTEVIGQTEKMSGHD